MSWLTFWRARPKDFRLTRSQRGCIRAQPDGPGAPRGCSGAPRGCFGAQRGCLGAQRDCFRAQRDCTGAQRLCTRAQRRCTRAQRRCTRAQPACAAVQSRCAPKQSRLASLKSRLAAVRSRRPPFAPKNNRRLAPPVSHIAKGRSGASGARCLPTPESRSPGSWSRRPESLRPERSHQP